MARALLEHETISGDEVRRLVRLGHQPAAAGDSPSNGSGTGAGHAEPAPPASPSGHQPVSDASAKNWPYVDEGGSSV